LNITLPLPADVDLSGLEYFPLYHERLKQSVVWLIAKRDPAIGFYSLNLWMRAFTSVPAGSIDIADKAIMDDVLASAAECYPQAWPQVRETVLRGWTEIGGRLHHRVVSEIAWEVWVSRLKVRYENAVNSWRNHAKACAASGREPRPHPGETYDAWLASAYPATHSYMRAAEKAASCGARMAEVLPNEPQTGPKVREGKGNTPLTPQRRAAEDGLGTDDGAAKATRRGKGWFNAAYAALTQSLGPLATRLEAALPMPVGARKPSPRYALVNLLHGATLERGVGDDRTRYRLVMPSRQRAQSLQVTHGELIAKLGEGLIVISWKGAKHG
jgi:hypothetical protein